MEMRDEDRVLSDIAKQIYIAAENCGASVDLLCILGSFRDTLYDSEILDLLKDYNGGKTIMVEASAIQ